MNNIEQWTKWVPYGESLGKKYTKKNLVLDKNFKILAENESREAKDILINFSEGVSVFRVTDIAYCSSILQTIDRAYGKNFHQKWTFFKVINSEYVKWLYEESLQIVNLNTNHYVFVFTNYIVDVVEF